MRTLNKFIRSFAHGAARTIRAFNPSAAAKEPVGPESKPGSWPLLAAGFGALLALMLISGLATLHRTTELYNTLSDLNRSYREDLRAIDQIRTGIHVSSVLVRDYLLDPSVSRATEIREELLGLRNDTEQLLQKMEHSFESEEREKVARLRNEINAYWESLDPVFDWSPQEKQAAAYGFLRRQIIPRRDTVLSLAADVQTFTDTTFRQQREQIRRNEERFRSFLVRTVVATVFLGLLVALMSAFRVAVLEKRARHHRLRTEEAERQMRNLSHQLVQMQEEERRAISRELHDEVGQMLTGLRMELRTLQRLHRSAPDQFDRRIEESRVLLEQTLQSVRDIAMGLRPSMLDDLGLEAALQWQIREFERRYEIPVTLRVSTDLRHLPDSYRTNLYRIVQEALTNCARHAKARSVEIVLSDSGNTLRVVIRDDGIGMHGKPGAGLGLLGIQERVRELRGTLGIESRPNNGTEITVQLPRQEAMAYD